MIELEAGLGTLAGTTLYGLYCITFIRYRNVHATSPCRTVTWPMNLLCGLLTVAVLVNIAQFSSQFLSGDTSTLDLCLNILASETFTSIRLVVHLFLIRRCWSLWDRNYWLMAGPITLSLTSFVMFNVIDLQKIADFKGWYPLPDWFFTVVILSFFLSLAVDVLTSSLITLKLFVSFRYEADAESAPVKDTLQRSRVLVMSIVVDSALPIVITQVTLLSFYLSSSLWFNFTCLPLLAVNVIVATTIATRSLMQSSKTDSLHGAYHLIHYNIDDTDV